MKKTITVVKFEIGYILLMVVWAWILYFVGRPIADSFTEDEEFFGGLLVVLTGVTLWAIPLVVIFLSYFGNRKI